MRRRTRTAALAAAAAALGLVIGAVASLSLQGSDPPVGPTETIRATTDGSTQPARALPAANRVQTRTSPLPPSLFFAWTSGGLPPAFDARVRRLPAIDAVAVVRSDTAWMARSFDAEGRLVDDPRQPFDIPIEASAIEPADLAAFLPVAYRPVVARLQRGEGVISESSARVRRIGVGGTIEMRTAPGVGAVPVRVAAVLPDDLVGATELMVADDVGTRIGVEVPRYALVDPKGSPTVGRIERVLRPVVGSSTALQVREFGDTLYPRHGDAVLPPVLLKLRFGEFAARPRPGSPGYLHVDGRWEAENIVKRRLPLVGEIQCHRELFPQLLGVIRELQRRGLGNLIRSEHGCYVPKFMLNLPNSALSHHAAGAAGTAAGNRSPSSDATAASASACSR
jgi:hypothetical protein